MEVYILCVYTNMYIWMYIHEYLYIHKAFAPLPLHLQATQQQEDICKATYCLLAIRQLASHANSTLSPLQNYEWPYGAPRGEYKVRISRASNVLSPRTPAHTLVHVYRKRGCGSTYTHMSIPPPLSILIKTVIHLFSWHA